MNKRALTTDEIVILKTNDCTADSWENIQVAENFLPQYVRHVEFSGSVFLGAFNNTFTLPGGLSIHAGISYARIHNCIIEDNVFIHQIHNYIANYHIKQGSYIENTNVVFTEGETSFGNGVMVPVMNEGGGREIPIFDNLSAHLAYILTLYRHNRTVISNLQKRIDLYAEMQRSKMGVIGENVQIINCGTIKNVRIGNNANIEGASKLINGSINSNMDAPVIIGAGVKCNDFIISSGVQITDSTLVSRCFVGQGCVMSKHYSALDSLFFSNCQGMHGEATAIFAGPYTVSYHKSSLLIAGMFSFLNAGSASNQSNHMYKLGPIHQGIAERGAKTTSNSYLLWPARIGAFTLVMGRHTKHSDTSDFPFSYLIENATESYLIPAINLQSVGTVRDAQKWPKRDNRKDKHKIDQINFNLLSPYTIQKIMRGIDLLEKLKELSGETTELYAYQNCIIRNSSLRRGLDLYQIVVMKFLGNSLISRLGKEKYTSMQQIRERLYPDTKAGLGEWCDLSGLITPQSEITILLEELESDQLTLNDIQRRFEEMHSNYYLYEWTWAYDKILKYWNKKIEEVNLGDITSLIESWKEAVVRLDQLLYNDAKKEFNLNSHTGFGIDGSLLEKQQDFESVRGRFESNPFIMEIQNHIQKKTELANQTLQQIRDC